MSRELLESNTPSENPKYKNEMNALKEGKNRKDIVKAVNTFVQGKLNTLAVGSTLSSFNDTVKSKKLLNKLVTDEHYLVMNDSGLQVVDNKKDTKGKSIDLDKRSHRKLVGKYLSYLTTNKSVLNTDEKKQAASDLVSYIKELNALADQHSLDIGNFIQTIKGKFFKQAIKDGKSLAKALNKDLNLDSTKYSYLEAGAFDGLKISEKEVQANEKIAVVKDKLQNTLKQVVLPS
ncbi:hypothetical protein KBB05_05440 [Patescibacteria group bacterium]|nr:hypothetical protein [Patescibacteria group bacterium]